jgi:uncharacterized protein (DUF433 family)
MESLEMSQVVDEYVRRTAEDGWCVAGSRVSLDSVVHAYWEGKSPEAIVEEFPTLTAEQVYGAIAFYLRNKVEIDQHFSQQAARWEELQRSSDAQHGPLLDRLRAQRKPDTGAQHAS